MEENPVSYLSVRGRLKRVESFYESIYHILFHHHKSAKSVFRFMQVNNSTKLIQVACRLANGISLMGKCTIAEKAPTATPIHQTKS